MAALFASGRIVDLIIGLTVIEAVALVLYWHRSGRGVEPSDLLINILSGISLMLAARSALVGAWWGWTGLFLFLAGVAHAAYLARRWR